MLEPFDCFFHGADLPEPEADDECFGFEEGAVDHGALFGFKSDTLAFRPGLKAFAAVHSAVFHQLFVELAHLLQIFRDGQYACL